MTRITKKNTRRGLLRRNQFQLPKPRKPKTVEIINDTGKNVEIINDTDKTNIENNKVKKTKKVRRKKKSVWAKLGEALIGESGKNSVQSEMDVERQRFCEAYGENNIGNYHATANKYT